jgi:hypothetical protein
LFSAKVIFKTYGINPYPSSLSPIISTKNDYKYILWATENSFKQIDLWKSIYAAEAYPILRGEYEVHIYVCEIPENLC